LTLGDSGGADGVEEELSGGFVGSGVAEPLAVVALVASLEGGLALEFGEGPVVAGEEGEHGVGDVAIAATVIATIVVGEVAGEVVEEVLEELFGGVGELVGGELGEELGEGLGEFGFADGASGELAGVEAVPEGGIALLPLRGGENKPIVPVEEWVIGLGLAEVLEVLECCFSGGVMFSQIREAIGVEGGCEGDGAIGGEGDGGFSVLV
jgi:hypothetical protein